MNKILAICTSPDKGGLELYFVKLVNYYHDTENKQYVSLEISDGVWAPIAIKKLNTYMNYYHKEKKYYKNNHQYNLKTTKYGNNNNSTSITSQQDPIQTLLFFHFIGLGFSLFENVLSTFFVNNTDKGIRRL